MRGDRGSWHGISTLFERIVKRLGAYIEPMVQNKILIDLLMIVVC